MTDAIYRDGDRLDGLSGFAGLYLVLALLWGGSTQYQVQAVGLEVLGAGLLGPSLYRVIDRWDEVSTQSRWLFALLACGGLLHALQLIPLPPGVWAALPGRQTIVSAYQIAHLPQPWLPLTLTPEETVRSFLGLTPAAAVVTAFATIGLAGRRAAALAVVVTALVSVLVEIGQRVGGAGNPFQLYGNGEGVLSGFFANRNHQAAFLASALPMVGALLRPWLGRSRGQDLAAAAIAVGVGLVLILGGLSTGSRASLGLMPIGAAGAVFIAVRAPHLRGAGLLWLGGSVAAAVSVVLAASFVAPLAVRFQAPWETDARFQIAPTTARAGLAFAPLGSGAGSFERVYPMFEAPKTLTASYVNDAHNDYLEVWLEFGLPGLLLILLFGVWFVQAGAEVVGADFDAEGAARLSGAVALLVILAHSWVDYPLREPAMAALGAFSSALLAGFQGQRVDDRPLGVSSA